MRLIRFKQKQECLCSNFVPSSTCLLLVRSPNRSGSWSNEPCKNRSGTPLEGGAGGTSPNRGSQNARRWNDANDLTRRPRHKGFSDLATIS